MRPALLLLAALAAGTAQAQQVYRCGNTFSQQPCGPDATPLRAGHAAPAQAAASEPPASAASEAPAARKPNWSAIARGVPEVGMSASELQSAMGAPDHRNAGQNSAGSDDQLVYYRDTRTIYVQVRNGVVASVQEQAGNPNTAAAQERSACLTPAQIRELEFEDARIANRYNDALHAELAKARACR